MKTIKYSIIDLEEKDSRYVDQAAHILFTSFKFNWPQSYKNDDEAKKEVINCITAPRFARAALDDKGEIIGWIGAISQYNGNVFEIHPLCVRADRRKSGIGLTLVMDIENEICKRGGLTIYLGTDDETHQTSLSEVDLYDKTWDKIKRIKNYKNHPYSFWEKMGYSIVGVIPDANGKGKPDIMMAKQARQQK